MLQGEWVKEAACIGYANLMFDDDKEGKGGHSHGRPRKDGTPTAGQKEAAYKLKTQRNLCASCPVLAECREWTLALPYHEPNGFLAGFTPRERWQLRGAGNRRTFPSVFSQPRGRGHEDDV